MTVLLTAAGLWLPGRLHDAALEIAAGELVCLVGPNGGGKTSLLHALAGIGGAPGTMRLDGLDPRLLGPSQRPQLLTYLPAARDIVWPLLGRDLVALGGGQGADLSPLELESLLDRRVNTLSTGERSRILLARALAPRPKLLLLDEPTANLDPLWRFRVMELIRSEAVQLGRAALVAIHDLDLAERYADRILVIDGGRIVAEGLSGPHMGAVFGVERAEAGWQPLSSSAGPRSSR